MALIVAVTAYTMQQPGHSLQTEHRQHRLYVVRVPC